MEFKGALQNISQSRKKNSGQLSKNDVIILTYLFEANKKFIADELWIGLRQKGVEISIGSVYYSLKRLVEIQVISKTEGGKQGVYGLIDSPNT